MRPGFDTLGSDLTDGSDPDGGSDPTEGVGPNMVGVSPDQGGLGPETP